MKRTNYLNNKDILAEIHKSKNTFCAFLEKNYHQFDIIINDINEINNNIINMPANLSSGLYLVMVSSKNSGVVSNELLIKYSLFI